MKHSIVGKKILFSIAASALLACAMDAAEIPLRKVVMYSSGVSYFEHGGVVKDDDVVSLHFTAQQMDNLLKSLVVRDFGGGTIGSIEYPAQNPLEKSLEAFPINVAGNLSRSDLLSQLRGAKVDFVFSQKRNLSGIVLGIESDQIVDSSGARISKPARVAVLTDDGSIQALNLDEIRSFTPNDPELVKELSKALATLSSEKNAQRKPFTIRFNGKGERKIVFGYVLDTPIWKCSYRLNLNDDGSARLQGWAIVENQTDSDWTNLNLSLVSGDPIFLRAPLYASVYNPATELREKNKAYKRKNENWSLKANEKPAPAVFNAMSSADASVAYESGSLFQGEISKNLASGEEIGALFEYKIPAPVTLPRRQATMLELLAADVPTEKVLACDPSVSSSVYNAFFMKNDTGKLLLRGPLAVYDAGAYGGDSEMPLLAIGGDVVARYGISADVKADPMNDSFSETVSLKAARGVLTIKRILKNKRKYVFRNQSEEKKTLILYSPVMDGWKLIEAVSKPWRTEDGKNRFRVELPGNQTTEFFVVSERTLSEEVQLRPDNWNQLSGIVAKGSLSDEQKAAWGKAVELQQKVVAAERAVKDCEAKLKELSDNQARTRNNLDRLSRVSENEFHRQLVERLLEEGKTIDAEQLRLQELRTAHRQAQKALEDYLSSMTF